MHSKVVENKPLVVCLAERKEKRQARFKSQSQNLEYQARFRPIRQPGKSTQTNTANAFPPPQHYPVNIQSPMPFGAYPQPGMRQQMMQGRGIFNPQARQSPFAMAQPMGVPGMHQARPGFQPRMQHFSRPQQMMPPQMNSMPYSSYGSVPQQQQTSMMHYRSPPSAGKAKPVNKRLQHNELITQLSTLSKAEAKQVLGEKLFTEIAKYEKHSAGKITGMLLELENSELVGLLQDTGALRRKMAEARSVLQRHLGQAPAE
jgi:polyadenylate-binding protein